MPMVIGSLNVVVTAYNSGTRIVTLQPADPNEVSEGEIINFDAGEKLCLGGS